MKKYIQVENDDKFEVEYEYDIDEEIRINSSYWAKCIKKEIIDNELIQSFVARVSMYSDEFKKLNNKIRAFEKLCSERESSNTGCVNCPAYDLCNQE